VEAILKFSQPKKKRQLRYFLGIINYYRYMWQKRSHMKCGEEQQKAFEKIKKKASQDTLLAFPDFEKDFHVYTDASNKQLGAFINELHLGSCY
jgi:hypothetical protein